MPIAISKSFVATVCFAAVCAIPSGIDTGSTVSREGKRMTDRRDGKSYRTIRVGGHVWMAENLDYSSDSSFCYDRDTAMCGRYGRMYDQMAARKACPEGWRLPSDAVWKDLVSRIGADGHGFPSKSWTGEGASDFGVEFGGQANIGGMGRFEQAKWLAAFWSSNVKKNGVNGYDFGDLGYSWFIGGFGGNGSGVLSRRADSPGEWLSVRCVQDDSLPARAGVAPVAAYGSSSRPGMVRIPAGCFSMGSEDGQIENYAHPVCLDSFELDRREVTNEAFEKGGMRTHYADRTCLVWNPDRRRYVGDAVPATFRGRKNPVVCVDWSEAETYCGSQGKRLPTEAEYEYAARAGTTTDYFWGDDPDEGCRFANGADRTLESRMPGSTDWMQCRDGFGFSTAPVGSFAPNPWGLYDMSGNVAEWVGDWYAGYDSLYATRGNPTGPQTGQLRSVRGGGWDSPPDLLKVHERIGKAPDTRAFDVGFRCVAPRMSAPGSTRVDPNSQAPCIARPSSKFIQMAAENDDTIALGLLPLHAADTVYAQSVRPLHIACDGGSIGAVRILLRKGVHVDVFNENGISPLEFCIDNEREDCVGALLRAGARPDTVDRPRDIGSPLFQAIRKKNRRIVGMLLDAGASLSKRHEDGETALMSAACNGDPEMLQLLLARGADLAVKDDDGKTAVHYATSCRNEANAAFFRKLPKAKNTDGSE